MEYKLVSDSCIDFSEKFDAELQVARIPFHVTVNKAEYLDIGNEIANLLQKINFKAKEIKTACPSPGEFYNQIKDAGHSFVITISSQLSGSYQSAINAKNLLLEKSSAAKVHIFDSKSAAAGQNLIAMKIKELADSDLSFEQIVESTSQYIEKMRTVFSLESLDLLASSGRVSVAQKFLTKTFNLFPIMSDDGEGKIVLHSFARGGKNALNKLVDTIGEYGEDLSDKILGITHVNAMSKAEFVREEAAKKYNFKSIEIFQASGLSTIYANNKGIILAF